MAKKSIETKEVKAVVDVCPNCSGLGTSAEDQCSNCEGKGTL